MVTRPEPASNWLQVRLLQGIGTTLRGLSVFSSSQKDRFHPPGFGRLTRWLGKAVFHPDGRYVFRFGENRRARFSFPLSDPYWSALLLPGREYESEVRETLSRVLVGGAVLLDCGANLGYWSCFATTYLDPRNIVAIEPLPSNFDQLVFNARLNGGFQCVQAAVHKADGQRMWLAGKETTTARIRDGAADSDDPGAWVQTISLDTICRKYVRSDQPRLVLKLDVEGAEMAALDGAAQLLQREPLLIYEDHGGDVDCTVSRYIGSRLGWQIYAWFPERGFQSVQIPEIRAIKHNPRVGYNFVACADPQRWPELGVAASSLR